ncbi:MAG TPA: hypothetical protein VEB22_13705, partial [Phycisphaerales bacterium]|nr:hypothetical protein [Phycisphaerales bacterium]
DGEWYELSYSGLKAMPPGGAVRLAPPFDWPAARLEMLEGSVDLHEEGDGRAPVGTVKGTTTSVRIRFR